MVRIINEGPDICKKEKIMDPTGKTLSDWVETVHACLVAAGGSEDVDELELQMGGMDPSEFVRSQFEKAQEKTDKTPITKEWLDDHFSRKPLLDAMSDDFAWTQWHCGIDTFGRSCFIKTVDYKYGSYTEFECGEERWKVQMINTVGHVKELMTAFGIESESNVN